MFSGVAKSSRTLVLQVHSKSYCSRESYILHVIRCHGRRRLKNVLNIVMSTIYMHVSVY